MAGATYVLRHPVRALLLDPVSHACIGVRTAAGQTLRCTALAADAASLAGVECLSAISGSNALVEPADDSASASAGSSIARAVCIIDGPLQVMLRPRAHDPCTVTSVFVARMCHTNITRPSASQDGESQLLVVIPPAAVGGNPGAIRVLQVRPSACIPATSTPQGAQCRCAENVDPYVSIS